MFEPECARTYRISFCGFMRCCKAFFWQKRLLKSHVVHEMNTLFAQLMLRETPFREWRCARFDGNAFEPQMFEHDMSCLARPLIQ